MFCVGVFGSYVGVVGGGNIVLWCVVFVFVWFLLSVVDGYCG